MLLTGKAKHFHGTHLHDYQRLILQLSLSLSMWLSLIQKYLELLHIVKMYSVT